MKKSIVFLLNPITDTNAIRPTKLDHLLISDYREHTVSGVGFIAAKLRGLSQKKLGCDKVVIPVSNIALISEDTWVEWSGGGDD